VISINSDALEKGGKLYFHIEVKGSKVKKKGGGKTAGEIMGVLTIEKKEGKEEKGYQDVRAGCKKKDSI